MIRVTAVCDECGAQVNLSEEEDHMWDDALIDEGWSTEDNLMHLCDVCTDLETIEMESLMNNKPKIGQWWMCQSKNTERMAPMKKVRGGWGSLCNAAGNPLSDFINRDPIFVPLYQMIRKSTNE